MASRRSASESTSVRKAKAADEITLKRLRGEASCAECRRLKLRCDRTVPCNSCIRRGCQAICPNGVLSSGQGSRFILADTNELHRKLTDMSNRIRKLEDALTISHATSSQTPHPLMAPSLLEIKHGLSAVGDRSDDSHATGTEELDKDIMLSFGDLTLAESGVSEALFTKHLDQDNPNNAEQRNLDTSPQSEIPTEVIQLSRTFPMSQLNRPENEIQELIEHRLPTYERASSLCENYLQHIGWLIRPIGREQLIEELLPAAYKQRRGRTSTKDSKLPAQEQEKSRMDPHDLAALLMVFAAGAVGDFTLSPCNEEAELYLHLGRAALGLKPVLEGVSLVAVQAVSLMGMYDFFSCRKKSLESTWKVHSFAMMLGTSIGLHRDPTHWKFGPKMIQRRREVFWELRYLDAWKCFASGRPAAIHSDDVDCELPIDSDATLDEEGKEVPSFTRWRQMFLKDVLLTVAQRLGSAKPLKYTDILALDGKVREFGPRQFAGQLFNQMGTEGFKYTRGNDFGSVLPKSIPSLMKTIIIQLLHRNFFARALFENPRNPMKSTFAPSVLAAYDAALAILGVTREHIIAMPHVMLRFWSFWSHALISSMILGSIAARVPASEMAPQAYINLDLSLRALLKAQSHPAIQSGLPGLLRLREKARLALIGVGIDPEQIVKDSKATSEWETQAENSGDLQQREGAYQMNEGLIQPPRTAPSNPAPGAESSIEWQNSTLRNGHLFAPDANNSTVFVPLFGEINSEPLAPLANNGPLRRDAIGGGLMDQGTSNLNGSENQASMSDEGSVLSTFFPRSAPMFQTRPQSQTQSQEFDFLFDIDFALDIPPEQSTQTLQAPTVFHTFSTTSLAIGATPQDTGLHRGSLQGVPSAAGHQSSAINLCDGAGQADTENRYGTTQSSFGMQECDFSALMALDVGPPDVGTSSMSSSRPGEFNIDWETGFDEFMGSNLGTRTATEGVSTFFGPIGHESLFTTSNDDGEKAGSAELWRLLSGGGGDAN